MGGGGGYVSEYLVKFYEAPTQVPDILALLS